MRKLPLGEYNAKPVLARLNRYIEMGVSQRISLICDDLSIFDWWPETLSVSRMKQMRTFLKEAIKLGYTGYVCFKVGASGCSNGMWAHKAQSEDGYSPKGDAIYRSFTPDYTYWSFSKQGIWRPNEEDDKAAFDSLKTAKMLEAAIAKANA